MMKKNMLLSCILAFAVPSQVMAYGEGADILESERILHLLVNETRSDPQAILKDCAKDRCREPADCYKPAGALYWDHGMHRAARFHAIFLSDVKCGDHSTACSLTETIADDFPDKCNGLPACACKGGKADCDGNAGWMNFQSRVELFEEEDGGSVRAENIAWTKDDINNTYRHLLFEKSVSTNCMYNGDNGHRWNFLSDDYNGIGIGVASRETVFDFSVGGSTENAELSSGAGYLIDNALWFKTHYYHFWVKADSVDLVLDGKRVPLDRIYGDETNGTYGVKWTKEVKDCTPYHFEASNEQNGAIRYPTTGNLLYHCSKSWTSDDGGGGCASMPLASSGTKPALPILCFMMLAGMLRLRRSPRGGEQ